MKNICKTIIKDYEEWLLNQEKAGATVKKYLKDVSNFIEYLEDRPLIKAEVLSYKECICQSLMPASVNAALSSLNSFFSFLNKPELRVKTLKIQRQVFANAERELTKKEYMQLLSAAKSSGKGKLYFIMQTICSTGIRVSELKFITIEALSKKKAAINMKGKLRYVLIPDQLCRMLEKYCIEMKIRSGSVFVTKGGKPMDRSNIWKLMKTICNLAGVAKEKVFPHNLRHLFARTFYCIQKDIVRLADILGHTSVNTTRIYTMESGDIHRKKIQCLGLLWV